MLLKHLVLMLQLFLFYYYNFNLYKYNYRRLTWAHHIKAKRLQLNFPLRMLKTLTINNKDSKLNIKLLLYKSFLKPI